MSKEILSILSPILNNPNFESILPILQNKHLILSTSKILSLSPQKTKYFLTCIMINFCPNDILPNIQEIEKQLITKASSIFDQFMNNLQSNKYPPDFFQSVNDYIDFFSTWQKEDKKKLIFIMVGSYHELLLTADIISKQEYNSEEEQSRRKIWLKEIEGQKKSLEKAIFQIGGEKAIDQLYNNTLWLEMMSPSMKESIESNIKNQLKNKLIQEISSHNKPFATIKCLKEIKDLLFQCIPNRQDLHQKYEKDLKIELLNMDLPPEDSQKIINLTLSHFLNLILQLESPNRNHETLSLLNKLHKCSIEILVDVFMNIYEKINLLYTDLQKN